MKKGKGYGIETTLRRPVDIDLNLNDLRIIVGCIGAVSYLSDIYDEPYLDAEGRKLMERLQGLYRDQLENRTLYPPGPLPRIRSSAS